MSNIEKYLQTGKFLAKFLDSTSKELGDGIIAGVIISLLDDCYDELSEEQHEDLALARMYWNGTIDRIPRQFFERAGSRIQYDDRSGAEHSKDAWLNRLIFAAFELEKDHHSNYMELVVEYALKFDIGVSVLEAAIASHTEKANCV